MIATIPQSRTIKVSLFYPQKKHIGQAEVLNSPARRKVLVAGRKWRKTSLGIAWLLKGSMTTQLNYPYVAPTKTQAKDIVWDDHLDRLLRHLKEKGVEFKINQVELSVKFPGYGKLQLFGVENAEALRGMSNWGGIFCDEYDDWKEDILPLVIRPNLMTWRAPIIVSGTPKGKGGLYRLSQNSKWQYFHYTSYDNPFLSREELDELLAEYEEYENGTDYYNQEILAEFIKPAGTVYKEWSETRQYIPFDYDPNLPVHVSWDFGVNDPTALIWLQPNGAELRAIDYHEENNVSLDYFVQLIRSKPYKTPSLHTGDIAGRARELTSGKSPIEELEQHGIYVRTSHCPDYPTRIRNTHKIIPQLYVSSKVEACKRLVDVLTNYRYPDKKKETALNQSNENPIHNQYSHGATALEFYAWNTVGMNTDLLQDNYQPVYDKKSGRMIS